MSRRVASEIERVLFLKQGLVTMNRMRI